MELLGIERRQYMGAVRPDESTLVQAAVGQPDTEAVIHQDLDAGGALVGKQVGVMGACRPEHFDDFTQGRVGTGAHIDRLGRQPDGVDADHRSQCCNQLAHSMAAEPGQRTVTVDVPRLTSMTISEVTAGSTGRDNLRGTNSATDAGGASRSPPTIARS